MDLKRIKNIQTKLNEKDFMALIEISKKERRSISDFVRNLIIDKIGNKNKLKND